MINVEYIIGALVAVIAGIILKMLSKLNPKEQELDLMKKRAEVESATKKMSDEELSAHIRDDLSDKKSGI